jgi:hypothetical protein
MFPSKMKIIFTFIAIVALSVSSLSILAAQMSSQPCETCSMGVDADAKAHLKVVDSSGTTHYVECMKCAFKVLKNNASISEITITTNCDWNGPSNVIAINLKKAGNITTVNPSSAMFIDGDCKHNRIVYDQASSDALIAHQGLSPYITAIQNVTVLSNATVMTFTQAAFLYAYPASPDPTPTITPSPSPTPSPTPISTSTVTSTPNPITPTPTPPATPLPTTIGVQDCEACGMTVNADAQAKYQIIDGTGKVHYAECYMCALNLINDYDNLTITSYCDWYGPNYLVTVVSSQFGKEVTVTPSTAIFLSGGSCVINRVAYNQTAADALLANGFSEYTLTEQHYALPANTKVTSVTQEALTLSKNAPALPSNLSLSIIIGAVAGVIVIVLSVVAYKKLK